MTAPNFPPGLEQTYLEARFAEYRRYAIAMSIAGALLVLSLWARDLAYDPEGARHTFPLRIGMASGILLYAAALWLRVSRGLILATGYVAILTSEFSLLAIWAQLAGGYVAGFPGYMYFYLVTPLVLLPFSFRESALVLVAIVLVPNLQVLLGVAPGFPVLHFNGLMWPACGIAVFVERQFDLLFRDVFLTKRELNELATRDSLTGLANRRAFLQRVEQACIVARRYGRPLAVLMLDIDHFKAVNDRWGHAAGDDLLRYLATTLELNLREADCSGRMGGEEFAVALLETDLEKALPTAERIRRAIERAEVATDHAPQPIRVTVSIGVAAFAEAPGSLDQLLALADERLYEAKNAGRNRVVGPRPAAKAGSDLELGARFQDLTPGRPA